MHLQATTRVSKVDPFLQNVWVDTTVVSGQWNDDKKDWTLQLLKGTETRTITSNHLIMSVGAGCQIPTMPSFPGNVNVK